MNERLEYLEKNFDTLSEEKMTYLKKYIDSIINNKSFSLVEKRLIARLAIKEKCEYYGYPPVKVEFGKVEIGGAGGAYLYEKNKIMIDEDALKGDVYGDTNSYPFYGDKTTELERTLLISNHECEHYFQQYDLNNGILSKKSFSIMLQQLLNRFTKVSKDGKNEYKVNYRYKEMENYANIQGWYDTDLFLARHGYSNEHQDIVGKLWLQASARQNFSYQKNTDGKSEIIEDYNIKELIDIIYKHPSYIENYPFLSYFFYGKEFGKKYGVIKETDLLLEEYLHLEQEYGKTKTRTQINDEEFIFRQFLYYLIGKDASKVSSKYAKVLYDLTFHELASLQGLFDFQNKNEKAYEKIVGIKINRICNFINRLCEINASELYDELWYAAKETLKVYETSKLMYNDFNSIVDDYMKFLREKLSITDVEFRDPEERASAMNI